MTSILVTGSNRGLGLGWVKHYAHKGWRVYATCRFPEQADALQQLATDYPALSIHRLDVTRADDLTALTRTLADAPIDILVNNAGVYYERWGKDKLGSIDYTAWMDTYQVNVLGAVRVTEALRHNLASSTRRLVVMTTSHMGSLHDIGGPNDYAYRSSKAALNAVVRGLVHELAPMRIGILLVHPGWVQTRMGGNQGMYTVSQSIENMQRLVENFHSKDSGVFYRCDGQVIPW